MKFCLGESEIDDSIHTIVSGPWDSCLECGGASSSSSSGECGACRMQQDTCGCWKTALGGAGADESYGVPKNWSVSIEEAQIICTSTGSDSTDNPCYIDPAYFSIFWGSGGLKCSRSGDLQDCNSSFVNSAPSFEASGDVQAWTGECDPSGKPINPAWGGGTIPLKISGACGGTESVDMEISFGPGGINILAAGAEFTNCGMIRQTFTGASGGADWVTRYRREYGDQTLSEEQIVELSFGGYGVRLKLTSSPTCRAPDTGQFCNCLDDTYNVVSLSQLPAYRADPGKCPGNPIDIDVICGIPSGNDPDGDARSTYSVYYTPYSNTVVVIGGVVYDTTKMPEPPPGKTNVLLVYTGGSRNDVRSWVCNSLKYATIRDLSRWPGMGGSSTSSGGVIDVTDNLDFNWPYNDLYFSTGCPGGGNVNLVPC